MKKLAFITLTILSVIFYSLTFRGNVGNPTPTQIEAELGKAGKPFETSQERSRYAVILSMYHEKSVNIDKYASMGTPDVGKINGHYYSFFPIGTSLLALPLYIIGIKLGIAQLLVFSISTIFAFGTMLLIVQFLNKLGAHWTISVLSALMFGFATNAWGYSVTLYAHLISAFLILAGLYLVSFVEGKYETAKVFLVWILYGLAVYVDFPNLFIFLPIVVMLSLNILSLKEKRSMYQVGIRPLYLFAPVIFLVMLAFYAWYNQTHFGGPLVLSNNLPRVKDLRTADLAIPEQEKNVSTALNTRYMLEGLRSFTISKDRGILIYSPVVLLFIFGIGYLKDKLKKVEVGLLALPAMCLVLYTMFPDPYGGWAFGSRYMIAVLPQLCILAGIGLMKFSKNIFVKALYTVVFAYSAGVSLLAPLTTNVIPPIVEARDAGLPSDYSINIKMLQNNDLNSFIYNNFFSSQLSGMQYYSVILTGVLLVGLVFIWYRGRSV